MFAILFWWGLHHEPAIFEISFFGRGVTLITPAGLHPDSVMFEAVILMAYGGGGFAPPNPSRSTTPDPVLLASLIHNPQRGSALEPFMFDNYIVVGGSAQVPDMLDIFFVGRAAPRTPLCLRFFCRGLLLPNVPPGICP